MEAYILTAPFAMGRAGHDVFSGVDLHPGETKRGVHAPFHDRADAQRSVTPVDDSPLPLVRVRHANTAEGAGIAALTAALGEKGRAVEYDLPAAFALAAFENAGVKGEPPGIGIVEFFGHLSHLTCCLDPL